MADVEDFSLFVLIVPGKTYFFFMETYYHKIIPKKEPRGHINGKDLLMGCKKNLQFLPPPKKNTMKFIFFVSHNSISFTVQGTKSELQKNLFKVILLLSCAKRCNDYAIHIPCVRDAIILCEAPFKLLLGVRPSFRPSVFHRLINSNERNFRFCRFFVFFFYLYERVKKNKSI